MIYATALLTLLATARVTRLITTDVLLMKPREVLVRALLERKRTLLAYLATCSWCASVYVSAAMAGAWLAWGGTMWFMTATLALAASYVTGALADRMED